MPVYDEIGTGYARRRRLEPRLAVPLLHAALGDAQRVLNVGAGTGSYEPTDRQVVALEPSSVMIRQRRAGLAPVIQGQVESMPFGNEVLRTAVMTVLTAHHWSDHQAGFAELRRVAQCRVVLTFDPEVHNRMWLMDYLPEIRDLRSASGPTIDEVVYGVGGGTASALPVPHDCPRRHDRRLLAPSRGLPRSRGPPGRVGRCGNWIRPLSRTGTGPTRPRSAERSLGPAVWPSSGARRVRLRPASRRE